MSDGFFVTKPALARSVGHGLWRLEAVALCVDGPSLTKFEPKKKFRHRRTGGKTGAFQRTRLETEIPKNKTAS